MQRTLLPVLAKRCLVVRSSNSMTLRCQPFFAGTDHLPSLGRPLDHTDGSPSSLVVLRLNSTNRILRHCSPGIDSFSATSQNRCFSTTNTMLLKMKLKTGGKPKSDDSKSKAIMESRESPYAGLTAAEKVREAGKDASYTVVIIIGIAVTGIMTYFIGRELFSSQSSSGVYANAFKLCKHSTKVTDVFGEPLKAYGEMSGRGRRRHVSHIEWEDNGVKHMRMKFYLEGPQGKGTVNLEVKKGESGRYEYRYLFVEPHFYPRQVIILEDNR